MYSLTSHPETGSEAYINRSGYLFTRDSIDAMPRRGSAIHLDQRQEVSCLLAGMETIKDSYLLKYF